MHTQRIAHTDLETSRIIYGCLTIGGRGEPGPLSEPTARSGLAALQAALDAGIDYLDVADIYSRGRSEEVLARLWQAQPHVRAQVTLQSKCGLRFRDDPAPGAPWRYDFSANHILRSVEESLRRLGTDHLDVLLLHRPDLLVEPAEVARAFDALQAAGKVRYFGVSNHTAAQIELLRGTVRQPLVINQLELNPLHTYLLDEGATMNQDYPTPARGAGTLEYCRLQRITVQAWSPLARGRLTGRVAPHASATEAGIDARMADAVRVAEAARVTGELAAAHGVSGEAILVAWLLRHPAQIQPVIGTTDPARIAAACQGDGVSLSSEEWYRLFIAGRGRELA